MRIHQASRAAGTGPSLDRPPSGSQHPFGSGRSLHPLSEPLQPGIRFLHDPLPTTVSSDLAAGLVERCRATRLWAYPVPYNEQEPGGFRLSAGGLKSACPYQANGQPTTYLLVRAMQGKPCAVDFALSSLTTFRWRFAFANPLTQPSASSGFRLPESQGALTSFSVPRRGCIVGALSTRSLPTPHRT